MTPTQETARVTKISKYQAYRSRTKARAIELLGGRCSICGFADERALRLCHRVPLQRRRQGLSKRALSSTDSHRAVVRGDGKGIRLLCANCSVIASATDTSINVNIRSRRCDGASCSRFTAATSGHGDAGAFDVRPTHEHDDARSGDEVSHPLLLVVRHGRQTNQARHWHRRSTAPSRHQPPSRSPRYCEAREEMRGPRDGSYQAYLHPRNSHFSFQSLHAFTDAMDEPLTACGLRWPIRSGSIGGERWRVARWRGQQRLRR